jgi:Flp pilus assembly protein TadD
LRDARSDAAAAFAREPSNFEVLIECAYLSALFDRDRQAAQRYFDQARRLHPDHSLVEHLRVFLPLMRGDVLTALDAVRGRSGAITGAAYYFARQYERAQLHLKAPAEKDASAFLLLAAARLFGGDAESAIADFRTLYHSDIDLNGGSRHAMRQYALACLIFATARSGRRAEAASAIADLTRLSRERYVSPMARAIAYAGMGDRELARVLVEEAVTRFDPWAAYIPVDPFLDDLREDVRFGRLVRQLAA